MVRLILIILLAGWQMVLSQNVIIEEPVRFLALGDSYTIGEGVSVDARWPVQLKDSLTSRGYAFDDLTILATTGWTTSNLIASIEENNISKGYSLVSLLIGVNNQFQGRSIENYETEFEQLLGKAIELAENKPNQVFVLSIPDYYFTPWGQSFGSSLITEQIEQFNIRNRQIARRYNVPYINITDISREGITNPALVATDGLHPSGNQYTLWVNRILKNITNTSITNSKYEFYSDNLIIYFNSEFNQLVIENINNQSYGSYQLELFSLQGKLLVSKRIENNIALVFLEDIPAGLYIYLITNKTRKYSGRIFISNGP